MKKKKKQKSKHYPLDEDTKNDWNEDQENEEQSVVLYIYVCVGCEDKSVNTSDN